MVSSSLYGGVLRIAVPDFNAIAQTYLADHDLESVMGLLYGGQNYDGNFHYQTYDENRMKRLLMEAGFTTAERYEWRDFLPDGYDDFCCLRKIFFCLFLKRLTLSGAFCHFFLVFFYLL